MGKLVLYLADGTTLDVRLVRERLTIGRRADNDVCLPYPAVSGEHAAVVTILADSFLEDLGSTNGTLVNGKPIAKHFLRDRDEIDIGRQRLVYVADDSVELPSAAPSLERLEHELPVGRAEPAAPRGEPPAARAPAREPVPAAGGSMADIERFVAAELGTARDADEEARREQPGAARGTSEVPGEPVARVRVLTGPNAGREVPLASDETVIGRVGAQVAAVRNAGGALRLVALEGSEPPRVNGVPIAAEGQILRTGDALEIAGVELQLVSAANRAD